MNQQPLSFKDSLLTLHKQADALMMIVLSVYMAVTILIAWIEASVLVVPAMITAGMVWGVGLVNYFLFRGQLLSRLTMAFLLMLMVGLQIHFGRGQLEFHFGVFVTLALLLMYQDWRPIVVGAATIAVHHVLGDFLQSRGVGIYCLPEPNFYRIVLHATYVVVQTGFQIKIASMLYQNEKSTFDMAEHAKALATKSQSLAIQLQQTMSNLRAAVDTVQDRTDQVSASASHIAHAAVDLSSRTDLSMQRLAMTFEAADHLSRITNNTASAATDVSDLVSNVANEAKQGLITINQVIQTMESVEAFSSRISEFVSVINGVAFQTNILALNAAVESARAGEQGRGFAVVADEIRHLAERSGQAARQIEELIKSNVGHIHESVGVVRDAGSSMTSMEASVTKVNQLVMGITQNMTQQLSRLHEVDVALNDLKLATQDNAHLADKSAESSKVLQQHAQELVDSMHKITSK